MGREIFLCCVHVRTGRNTNKGVVNVSCSILALLGHARLDDGAERKGRQEGRKGRGRRTHAIPSHGSSRVAFVK